MAAFKIQIRIVTEPIQVSKYLNEVVEAADGNKVALGFFPRTVYSDFCRKELLFVALISCAAGELYAGHLLFDTRFPKAHIRQIYVHQGYRGQRIGQALLRALKSMLTEGHFISINARVAEDLKDANMFWEAQGFYAQRVQVGGASRNRMIIVRVHELESPQLFAASGIKGFDPLGLNALEGSHKPLYLLDLNVLFDLGPRRPRHKVSVRPTPS